MPEPRSTDESTDEPCRCMKSFAAISPTHPGHCCFVPATQTCHPEAVRAWQARKAGRARGRDRMVRRGGGMGR